MRSGRLTYTEKPSVIGITLGVKEYRQTGRNGGLVVSILGEVCAIINSMLGILVMQGLMNSLF